VRTYGRQGKLLFSVDSCELFLGVNAKNTLHPGVGLLVINHMRRKELRVRRASGLRVPRRSGVALEQRVYPVTAPLPEIS
jgi:hypothetical protein